MCWPSASSSGFIGVPVSTAAVGGSMTSSAAGLRVHAGSCRLLPRTRGSALDRAGAADLLLQQQHPVKKRLRGRRAARYIDIHWHDAIAAPHHGVGIVVIAA